MADVPFHYNTIQTLHGQQGKPYFLNIFSCPNDILYARFQGFRALLYIFMSVAKVFRTLRIMG